MSHYSMGDQSETQNRLHSTLSNESNRQVVTYFRESSVESVSLEELAEYVADAEATRFASPDRAAVQLHHSSLPKLTAEGVVDYDSGSKTVHRCGHFLVTDGVTPVLDVDGVA